MAEVMHSATIRWWLAADWDDTCTKGAELAKAISWYIPVAANLSKRWQDVEHQIRVGEFLKDAAKELARSLRQDARFQEVRSLKGLSRAKTLRRMLEYQERWARQSERDQAIVRLLTGEDLEDRREALKEFLLSAITEPFTENVEPLEKFAGLGISIAIVTSATKRQVLADASRLGIPIDRITSVFACVGDGMPDHMDGDPCSDSKAVAFFEAGKRLGRPASEGIAFDDSPAGVAAAVRAGLTAIGISAGDESAVESLRAAGARHVVADIATAVADRNISELLDCASAKDAVVWFSAT